MMCKKYIICFIALVAQISGINAFSFFGPEQEKSIDEITKEFQEEQVNDPDNPQTNYNLGVAFYKQKQFENAITSFDRSIKNCNDKDVILKKQGYFNMANIHYKNALAKLSYDWQSKEIEDGLLEIVINQAKSAVENYKNCLVLEKSQQAEHNKSKSEELLKKLEEKRKKQQQQNKDQNQSQKDQQKPSESKDDSAKPEDSQNQKNEQRNGDKEAGKSQDQGQDQPQKDQQKNNSDEHKKPSQDQSEQQQDQSSNGANGTQNEREKQALAAAGGTKDGKESMEKRSLGAMLDMLQNEEAKLQKNLVTKKLKNTKQPLNSSQKPW